MVELNRTNLTVAALILAAFAAGWLLGGRETLKALKRRMDEAREAAAPPAAEAAVPPAAS